MTDWLQPTYEEFEALAHEAQVHAFGARALELQVAVREKVEAFANLLLERKAEAVSRGDEQVANQLLLLGTLTDVVYRELSMWINLKADCGEAAWANLVDAQRSCESAIRLKRRLFGSESVQQLENLLARYDAIERCVFPPQLFCSPGGIAKRTTCSICGIDYDACEHVVGRAYMGTFCARIIEQFEVHEISVVSEPASKHCRATHFTDGGLSRNRMTWRLEGSGPASGVSSDGES